jgi:hypothetical protein
MSTTVREYSGSGFPSGPISGNGTAAGGTALLVGSAWRSSSTGETFETLNPANGQVLAHVAAAAGDPITAYRSACRGSWRAPGSSPRSR